MNWYETHLICKNCKGCEAVANGEAECFIELEDSYYEEDY